MTTDSEMFAPKHWLISPILIVNKHEHKGFSDISNNYCVYKDKNDAQYVYNITIL